MNKVLNNIDELRFARGGYSILKDRLDAVDTYPTTAFGRQAVINGNFEVSQRGTLFVNPSGYVLDRWRVLANAGTGGAMPATITVSQQAMLPDELLGSTHYMRLNTSGAGTVGTGAYYLIAQYIEGGVRKLCGLGKKVTLSFWARSDISGKRIGAYITQIYGTGGAQSTDEAIRGSHFTLTTNWTKYTITLHTNTLAGKTFSNIYDCLRVHFAYAWDASVGTGVVDAAFPETFGGAGNIDIAQVQLCSGGHDLPYHPKHYHDELLACMRYYERFDSAGSARFNIGTFASVSSTLLLGTLYFKVEKRSNPNITQGGGFRTYPGGVGTTIAFQEANKFQVSVVAAVAGITSNQAWIVQSLDTGGWIAADAEL